jgi:hypothetical protein
MTYRVVPFGIRQGPHCTFFEARRLSGRSNCGAAILAAAAFQAAFPCGASVHLVANRVRDSRRDTMAGWILAFRALRSNGGLVAPPYTSAEGQRLAYDVHPLFYRQKVRTLCWQ